MRTLDCQGAALAAHLQGSRDGAAKMMQGQGNGAVKSICVGDTPKKYSQKKCFRRALAAVAGNALAATSAGATVA
jgi:hypothetical protein